MPLFTCTLLKVESVVGMDHKLLDLSLELMPDWNNRFGLPLA
jgi:hypothetical protein